MAGDRQPINQPSIAPRDQPRAKSLRGVHEFHLLQVHKPFIDFLGFDWLDPFTASKLKGRGR